MELGVGTIIAIISISVTMTISVLGLVWKISGFMHLWQHKLNDLEPLRVHAKGLMEMINGVKDIRNKLNDLEPLRVHAKDLMEMINGVKDIRNKLNDLEPLRAHVKDLVEMIHDVKDIRKQVANILGSGGYVNAHSPIELTEKGRDLAKAMNASELADKYINELEPQIKGMNAYEIQEQCFSFAKEKLLTRLKKQAPASFDKIYELAYQEGTNVLNFTEIIGVLLRDKLLERNGKSHEDVYKKDALSSLPSSHD